MLSFQRDVCLICHSGIGFGKRTVTSCNHCFCSICLNDWVMSNQSFSCPSCAGNIIEANALFSMAEYRIDTIDNERHLIVSFVREEGHWYYLGNMYDHSVNISHDVRTVDGKEVVQVKINAQPARFIVLRRGFTDDDSNSQRAVSCANVFIDLQTSSLYGIKEDFTIELIGRVGEVGVELEVE